jgi:hypothetical protein
MYKIGLAKGVVMMMGWNSFLFHWKQSNMFKSKLQYRPDVKNNNFKIAIFSPFPTKLFLSLRYSCSSLGGCFNPLEVLSEKLLLLICLVKEREIEKETQIKHGHLEFSSNSRRLPRGWVIIKVLSYRLRHCNHSKLYS